MEPRIQYTKTQDGVSIAYWTLGEGSPLMLTPPLAWSNIAREWQIPTLRTWYERLASRRMLVRYDFRNTGMSERDVGDFSLDACVSDIEAVAGRLGPERMDIVAFSGVPEVAIAYVARHSERVSRLVLWDATVHHRDPFGTATARTPAMMVALAQSDWELATETEAHVVIGWSRGQLAHQWAAFIRASVSQADCIRFWQVVPNWDVTPLLPQITARTLALQTPNTSPDHSRVLTSKIPGAQLVRLGPGPRAVYEHEEGMRLVEEFLSDEPARAPERPSPGLYTILFTDIADSTALTQRLGDAKAQELVRAHNSIVREALKTHGGTEIKQTGDGIMASFGSASAALECAITIQRAVEVRGEANLAVHIGLNAGEPVAEEGDLFGTTVQLARRICDHAGPGQVLVPDAVRHLVGGKDFLFSDIGDVLPKGFDEAVRLYEVRWRAAGSPEETGG